MKLFKTIKRNIVKTFAPFANEIWWPNWSNIRWCKAAKSCELQEEDKVKNVTEIRALVDKLYDKFTWTADDITELGDSITPPAQTYIEYLNGELKDDCDGFHSLVFHCLKNSGFECYLMTCIVENGGHCVLVFKHKDKWYVNDYDKVYTGHTTLQEAVEDYNSIYLKKYHANLSEVLYNGFIIYDYEKTKFYSVKKELYK